jgi:hypothetical protein
MRRLVKNMRESLRDRLRAMMCGLLLGVDQGSATADELR